MADANDFELAAFDVLDTAKDYNQGIDQLKDLYASVEPSEENASKIKAILSDYGDQLSYKFKTSGLAPENLLDIAPYKPSQAVGADDIEKINDWEKQNLASLATQEDPDYLVSKNQLTRQIGQYASETRRDIKGSRGTGAIAWTTDKFFRAAEGSVGGLARLFGDKELGKSIIESTDRKRDEDFSSMVSSGVGTLIPVTAGAVAGFAVGGPAGSAVGGAVAMGADITGRTEDIYERYKETTGDDSKAFKGAAINVAANSVGFVPYGRILGKSTAKFAAKTLGEAALDQVVKTSAAKVAAVGAGEAAIGGAAGQLLNNVGEAIGTDTKIDLTKNVVKATLAEALLGGSYAAAHTVVSRAYDARTQKIVNEMQDSDETPPPSTPKEGPPPSTPKEGPPESDPPLHGILKTYADYPVVQGVIPLNKFSEKEQAYLGLKNLIETRTNEKGQEITGVPLDVLTKLKRENPSPDEEYTGFETARPPKKTITSEELAPFEKNAEGKLQLKEVPVMTVQDRMKATEKAYENAENYVNKEIPNDNKLRDQVGDEVDLPQGETSTANFEDFIQDTSSGKPILLSPTHIQPNGRFATWLAGHLGATTALRRAVKYGAFGVASADVTSPGVLGNFRIDILRSLGADATQFTSTLGHELGHILDYAINAETVLQPALKDVALKVIGVAKAVRSLVDRPELRQQAADISKAWRPGWDDTNNASEYGKYRANPNEVYADMVSAIINAPTWVKDNFPETWNAFEDRLSGDSELNDAWNHIQSFENDPSKISGFNMDLRREARKEQLVRDVDAAEEAQADKTIGAQLKRFLAEGHEYLFNRLTEAEQVVNRLPDKFKEQGIEALQNIQRKDYVHDFFKRMFDAPLQAMNFALKQAGISVDTFAHYLWSKRVLEESTNTIERVKANPNAYRNALVRIVSQLADIPEVNSTVVTDILNPKNIGTTEGLIDTFARIGIVTDAQRIPSLAEIAQKYPITDPERGKKAQAEYQKIKRIVDKGTHSIPREKLTEWVNGLDPEDPETGLIKDVLSPNAFNARKYLVGGGGTTTFDATRDIAHIEKQLGQSKTKVLKKQADAFHKIHAQIIPEMDAAHLLTDDMRDRMTLNASNYVTANILKFYENSTSIDAGIRASIGSLSEMGNELASTYLKSKVIVERAYTQRAANNMVQLGRLSEYPTTPIAIAYGKNIFDERALLSNQNKDASYLIEYKEGVPALYQIADGNKSFENMLKNPESIPGLSALGDVLDKFNRAFATRTLLTNLSPAFALNQPFMDRFNESIQSKSWTTVLSMFLPFHASSKLRNFRKESRLEANQFIKTGKLAMTGPLRDAVDQGAILTSLISQTLNGVDPTHTFENSLYAEYGIEPPAVKDIFDKMGASIEAVVRHLPFMDALSRMSERDEMVTKLTGYKIGLDIGMSKAGAAIFARQRFGNPDPLGGGIAATTINKYFLFGRAHFNGIRQLVNLIAENKTDPKFMGIAATVLLAKAMTNSAIMQPVITALFGDEEAKKYDTFLARIPRQEKLNRQILPIGFQDEEGTLHNMLDVKSDEIQPSWKAVYVRIPQNRELTNVASVLEPLLRGEFAQSAVAAGNQAMASSQPVIQYMINMGAMLDGRNPEDAFRGKAILSRDVQEAGGPQRYLDYAAYVVQRQFSTFIPTDPFATEDKTGPLGVVDQPGKIPGIGKMVHNFFGATNYGLIENDKAHEATKVAIDAQIRSSTKDSTQYLLEQARYFNAKTVGKKKEERAQLGQRELTRGAILKSWEAKVWHPFRDELRMAKDAENSAAYDQNVEILESLSKEYQALLSENPDIPEKD